MAELAVAAAAAQFIDLGGGILSTMSKIIAECRDAPQRISTLQGEVQQLIKLIQITQTNSAVAAVFNASIDRELLFDTIGKAERLQRLLGELHVDSDNGLLVRTWAAIRTVKKDRELEALCEGLERQKSNLLIWFANHNLQNLLGINSSLKALGGQIEVIDKNAGESLPQIIEINNMTKTIHQEAMDANQEHIAGLETIDRHLECLGNATNESLPLVKDVDIRTRSIHQELTVAAKENRSSCQTIASRVDDLCGLTNHSVPLIRVLDERTQNINSDLQLVRPSIQDSERRIQSMIKSEISRPLAELQASLTALMTMKEGHVTEVQAHQSTIARAQYQLLSKPGELQSACDTLRKEDSGFAGKVVWGIKRYRLCQCVQNRQIRDIWKGWRYWRLSWESCSQHSSECPLYTKTQKTRSVRIRCMLPALFLSRAIDYTFAITSGAGGFAISPQLTVLRMVDNSSSAILEVRSLVYSVEAESDEEVAQRLEDGIGRLRSLFCAGKASPFDVDPYGRSLLHIFMAEVDLWLFHCRDVNDLGAGRILYQLLVPFLSMCLTLGIGKDYMRHHIPWGNRWDPICSRCAVWSRIISYLHVNEGWQLSDFSNYLGPQGTVEACLQLPHFVEDSDFGPVSQAILTKQEAKLRELIHLGYDLGEQDGFGLTPLHLSIYWPLGMKILLAAGVQANGGVLGHPSEWTAERTILRYTIANRQDEAILLLLSADSGNDEIDHGVFQEIVWSGYEPSSLIVTVAIETMVQRSNRLRNLAIAHLSPHELDRLCISREDGPIQILDAYAAPTANALENVGVKTPGAWKVDSAVGTVYHVYKCSPELADRFWSSGFRDTNLYNEDGFTPLHEACSGGQLDMVNWLMFHGGDPTTVVRGHTVNAFHLLLSGDKDRMFSALDDDIFTGFLDVASRMDQLCGTFCQDDCRCACSPQGCTPTAILLRGATRTWCEKVNIFSSWCRSLNLSPDATETCCLEFARLETFERLGITHVCCEFSRYSLITNPTPQDIEEIQDEESEMIDQLESWMVLYEEERAKFEGSAIKFLSKWSDMLRDELDVPAPFEECWSQQVRMIKGMRMPDYFAKPLHSKGDTHIT